MLCANKAVESASARLCARHEDTHVYTEYEIGVSYSPDTEDGSVSTAIVTKPPAKRGMDDAMRRSVFGSSDESDEPSPKRRRSRSRDSGANSGVGSPMDTTSQRGASPSVGTSQEDRDRSVFRLAPEKKAWMPPKSVMDHLSATTSDRYRTRLFNSSRIYHLDPSAKNYRAENEFFIDAFFRHRWYSGNHNRDGPSLLQAWNAYIHNLEDVGRDAWNDKLIRGRDKFEKRTPTGARYNLHRLSREARGGAHDVPRCTAQPDPVRLPSVGSGGPKYPRTGDSRATGRDDSSDVRSSRGGSTAAQLDSAGHRESPIKEVVEEERRSPHDHGDPCVPESFFDRVTQGLRDDLEHERDRRLQLADTVSKHRDEFAFAQLENERALTSLRTELRVARGIADRSRDEIAALQTLVDAHHREHKALCEMLEHKGVLHRKKQRTDGTA
uniref:Uncharacterized protein n=1 Tax=Peronospora matthiolae TaxID=2874970 RepID=A0AAV1VH44_9STRA